MTKDKILSAEEMIDAISSLAQSIYDKEYDGFANKSSKKIFDLCKKLKKELIIIPAMTEEESKILSAEEMFDQYLIDSAIQRGQKDGIEQLAEMKVEEKELYDSVILLLNRFANQFKIK